MQKTTRKHFDAFRRECLRLQKAWGLLGWELNICHEKPGGDSLGWMSVTPEARTAAVTLATQWPEHVPVTTAQVVRTARHEMVHLLIEPLATLSTERYVTSDEIQQANHEVTQHLMYLLFP